MADYQGVLADLKKKRAALEQERTQLDVAIAAIERLLASANQAGRTLPTEVRSISPRAFAGLTMPQAIVKYLKQVQEPQTKMQIKEALKAGGMRLSQNYGAHIYNTLHRLSKPNGLFRRESDGRWSLREWPPLAESNATLSFNAAV